MKKKLLGILFVLGLLLALPSVVSFAEIASGTCGAEPIVGNVKWVLDDNGTLTIRNGGNGTAMADYTSASKVPWKDYIAAIKAVKIKDKLANIGAYAFSGCESLTSVTIPKSVTKIGDNAFENCTNLTDVYYAGTQGDWNGVNKGNENGCLTNASISYCICGATGNEANVKWALDDNGILTISGSGAMEGYYSVDYTPWYTNRENIQIVVIENGVTNVGDRAFGSCTNLTSVTIPDSVGSIGAGAFWICSNLQSVTIPDSVKSIGNSVFFGCTSLKSVTIPDSVGSIGVGAFWDCSNLQSVTIPDRVTSIEDLTFVGCKSLTSVTIPDRVTSIGNSAFYSCTSLESVVIPGSVESIGDDAFKDCNKLADVYYTGTKAEWDALTKGSGNVSLTNVTLHYYVDSGTCGTTGNEDKVTWTLDNDGTLTISGSGDMKDYAANEVPWYDSIKDIKNVKIGYGVINVGDNAFSGCTSLTSTTIPLSVNSMGNNAFSGCTGLTSMSIPLSVTNIGNSTFYDCTGLTSVLIPKSVTTIGSGAFNGCVNLAVIYIPEGCSVDTSAIPDVASQINYRVEHTTKNKGIDDEKIVVITSATKSITLNCDSMGNGYYIIDIGDGASGVTLSTVCTSNKGGTTTTHTGYSMRRRKKINAENHVYGCVAGGERRCIDCGAEQACTGNPSEVKSGNLTYNCYTCGDGIKVVELNLAAA